MGSQEDHVVWRLPLTRPASTCKHGGAESSQFRVLKSGWYRVQMWYIGTRHWNHAGLWLDNRHIHHGHEYTNGHWFDQFIDVTWKFNRGSNFWVQIYGTGHGYWNYHS